MKAQDWKNDGSQIFHVSYEYPDSGKNIIGLPTKIVNGGVATEYTYDANGNITSATENKKKVSYVYDGLNRLVRENNELLNKTITYYYDEGGNLREEREYDYTTDPVSGTPKKLTTAVMDEKWKDKLLKWGSTEMTYDACGNMLKKGDTTFTWTQGRKLSAINNGKNIRYYYDHTGARVKKVVDGVTTEYRMAGSLLVSERTGDETIWYQYDSAASLVAMIIGGTRYNYVRNAQNDIVGLIDSTGKRVVYYKYDSWGRTVNISGTMAATVGQKNPFRYRGYYFDAESGMYYLQSRYYDPEIRRFISADDVGILTGDQSILGLHNLYEYCLDNPVGRLDENGHFSLPNWAKVVAGTAVIVGLAVATVATCGTAAIVCGAALTGAIAGGGAGAVVGAIADGVDGAASGFMIGTAAGGIAGAALAGGNIASGGVKIIGTAQKTHTVLHEAASNLAAGQMAMQPGKYSTIAFDRALKTVGMIGRKRPDVIGVARYGANMIVEVVSRSQTGAQMNAKCDAILRANPGATKRVMAWVGVIGRFWHKLTR